MNLFQHTGIIDKSGKEPSGHRRELALRSKGINKTMSPDRRSKKHDRHRANLPVRHNASLPWNPDRNYREKEEYAR